MNTKENLLIANFMGLQFSEDDQTWYAKPKEGKSDITRQALMLDSLAESEELLFDKNWAWLMPVVEQICLTKLGEDPYYLIYTYPRTFGMLDQKTNEFMVRFDGFSLHKNKDFKKALYSAVIEFLENYEK